MQQAYLWSGALIVLHLTQAREKARTHQRCHIRHHCGRVLEGFHRCACSQLMHFYVGCVQWMPLAEFQDQPFFKERSMLKKMLDVCIASVEGKYRGFRYHSLHSGFQKADSYFYYNNVDLDDWYWLLKKFQKVDSDFHFNKQSSLPTIAYKGGCSMLRVTRVSQNAENC